MSGKANREIMVLLGHGPAEEIEKRVPFIEEYSPEATYREWVRARLDAD